MGAQVSRDGYGGAIPAEYITKEILGYVAEDDYLVIAAEGLAEYLIKLVIFELNF